ncbi:nitric oxide dioxygenase [Pedobacter sp. UYP30]|uniref:NO-inducible flavohemoprotein n=1 Tax=Pedobacter sp. UYP30 TaxID=1756400 RepID=UPI00339842E1
MTKEDRTLVKATVPFLKTQGAVLTKYFYKRMFDQNPEMKNIFNMGNQQTGKQQTALAMAVLAYAENIDNPTVLMPVLDGIGNKHVSLDIRPEHYLIIGEHLLAAIAEVVGDGATKELLAAWETAYYELADLMSGHEASLYRKRVSQPGGWTGWKPFLVKRKEQESSEICSFYLYPSDGGAVASYQPGQYISVRLFLSEINLFQPRQYSISTAPNGEYYRISVKRETSLSPSIQGMISNHLHNQIVVGDVIEVSAPSGNFVLVKNEKPVVFISGGVGQTPLLSMLESLIFEGSVRKKTWIHGCKSSKVHAFEGFLKKLEDSNAITKHIFYAEMDSQSEDGSYKGWVDLNHQKVEVDLNADYYLCGPKPFIEKHHRDLIQFGVNKSSVYFEEFGPQTLQLN